MYALSAHREASSSISDPTTAVETMPASASELPKRRRVSATELQTHMARNPTAASLIAMSVLIANLTSTSATAEDTRLRDAGPDESDLRYFLKCSELANTQLLSFDEAKDCSGAFMRIKLFFVPGVGLDDFEGLSAHEKAAVDMVGYRRYVEWHAKNTAVVEALSVAPLSPSDAAKD